MQTGPPRRRRARPVSDAPVDALLARTEDLAKGWLLALLEEAPLEASPAILAADLARDGPRVCDAVVRAIADDTDLARLKPGGALERLVGGVGAMSGATGPDAASRAVDALHAVVWSAVRAELRSPEPDQVSELAERLSLVTELVRGAVLRNRSAAVAPGAPQAPAVPAAELFLRSETPAVESSQPPGWLSPESPAEAPEALWVRALEDEIRRCEHSGTPLSLLLAELEDADRITAVEPGPEAHGIFSRFTQAVRTVARRQDIVVCETETRAWIIARDTARTGAQALASRIGVAVRERSPWRGAPMIASIGFAVLGAEGRTAPELIEAAEEARFQAAASGR
jgi:GGDEF domain-containing protein